MGETDVVSRDIIGVEGVDVTEQTDRFIGNNDAALQQYLLDQADVQQKYSQTARAMICGGKRWFL